jgi:hypothetical protein
MINGRMSHVEWRLIPREPEVVGRVMILHCATTMAASWITRPWNSCASAVGQIEQGAHPEDVAAGLGMTRAPVYGWLANTAREALPRSRPARSPDAHRMSGCGSTSSTTGSAGPM